MDTNGAVWKAGKLQGFNAMPTVTGDGQCPAVPQPGTPSDQGRGREELSGQRLSWDPEYSLLHPRAGLCRDPLPAAAVPRALELGDLSRDTEMG